MNHRQMNYSANRLAMPGIVLAMIFAIFFTMTGGVDAAEPGAGPATPPTTPPAPPPISGGMAPNNALKTSVALSPMQIAAVKQAVKAYAARLALADDPDAAAAARVELIAASTTGSPQNPPSVAYLTEFLPALNSELKPLAENRNIRVRVNVGIVTARVMGNVNAVIPPTALLNTTEILMKDPSDAVALWGVKAAGNLLNAPGATPNPNFLNSVVSTVEKHNLNGPITEEAYIALQAPDPKVIATLIKLYDKRINAYKNGLPPEPGVDRHPSFYFVAQSGMWKVMTPLQQSQVAHLMAELLTLANTAMNGAAAPADSVADLKSLIIDTAKAISVVGISTGDGPLDLDAKKLTRVANLSPSQITPLVQAVVGDVQRVFPQAAPAANGAKP